MGYTHLFEEARDGNKVPVIKSEGTEIHLGSLYDGKKAAEIWLEPYRNCGAEHLILFGMGDGQILLEASDFLPGLVLVLEPDEEIYEGMKRQPIFRKISKCRRIKIYVGNNGFSSMQKDICAMLNDDNVDTTLRLDSPGYVKIFEQEIQALNEVCQKYCDDIGFLKPSIKMFIESMIHHQLYNIKFVKNGIALSRLKKKWNREMPVILVSAGPSLEKNVEELKRIGNRAWIFCVDAALPTLLRHDVVPDVVGCVDSLIRLDWLEDERSLDIPFFITTNSPTKLLEQCRGVRVWGEDHDFINMIYEKAGIEPAAMPSYGGVSTFLLASMLELGTKEIVFIGQDLSYSPDGKSHVTGREEAFVEDKQYILDGYYGGKVQSRGDWITYHAWFEKVVPLFLNCKFINATEGGAKIQGTVQQDLSKVIESFAPQSEEKTAIWDCESIKIGQHEFELIKNEMCKCRDDIEKISQEGYEKIFFKTDYQAAPIIKLIIDYMKSLDDKSRKVRFEKALAYVKKEIKEVYPYEW